MKTPLLALLALCPVVHAQVTYVDAVAGAGGNTTLADGSAFNPTLTVVNDDDQWSQRPFANGGTIMSTNDANATGKEDGPMLRTRITGLLPLSQHLVYGYFWGTDLTIWRGRALVSTSQPAPPLPGYNTRHFAASAFSPMTVLADDSPKGTGQSEILLQYDSNGIENTGHFTNSVMIQEGNRWLFEVALGVFTASVTGEIDVYIDDLENTGNSNRTWYDGVGHKPAPFAFGRDCGSPMAPSISFTGEPTINQNLGIALSGAQASTPCMLILGVSNTTWGSNALPFDLSLLGFPGCTLNVSYDIQIPRSTDSNGEASVSLPVPAGTPNVTVYWQWAVLNPASFAVTAGLETTISR